MVAHSRTKDPQILLGFLSESNSKKLLFWNNMVIVIGVSTIWEFDNF